MARAIAVLQVWMRYFSFFDHFCESFTAFAGNFFDLLSLYARFELLEMKNNAKYLANYLVKFSVKYLCQMKKKIVKLLNMRVGTH